MKKICSDDDRMCRFCENSAPVFDETTVLCKLCGIVGKTYVCKKFEYDPLKRTPSAVPKIPSVEFIDLDKDI